MKNLPSPKTMIYRDMKKIDKFAFKCNIKESFKNVSNYDNFEEIFENFLDKHEPKNKKAQRANSKP